jgi:hypothetical protein
MVSFGDHAGAEVLDGPGVVEGLALLVFAAESVAISWENRKWRI